MLSKWCTQLIFADPGLVKLMTAIRATLTIIMASILLFYLAAQIQQPVTMAFIGIVAAMLSSIAVNDTSRQKAQRTMLLIPGAAGLALTAGTSLAHWHIASIAGFCAFSFASVISRRYGPRWIALGITSFMTYFCALFFQASPNALPWMIIALLLATSLAFIVRFWLLPDRPERHLYWALEAYRLQLGLLLKRLAAQIKLSERSPKHHEIMLRDILRINETTLHIEDFLQRPDTSKLLSARRCAQIEHRVFEIELAMSALIDSVLSKAHRTAAPEQIEALRASVLVLAAYIDSLSLSIHTNVEPNFPPKPTDTALAAIGTSAHDFIKALSSVPVAPAARERVPVASVAAAGLHANTKQAIQATCAVIIAAIVGSLVSPATWSWAALAAFIVFSGSTRGDTVKRALQRVLGTAFGLIAGLGLATVFSDRSTEIVLIFMCIFLGIYSTSSSYAWATMWFTAMVAVLYRLLGRLSGDILLLRLEQTLIGVGFAVLATLLVLPASTRVSIGMALVNFLKAYGETFSRLTSKERSRQPHKALEDLRLLDTHLRGLRLAASPMFGQYQRARSRLAEGLVHDAAALIHYARQLTTSAMNSSHTAEQSAAFDSACEAIAERFKTAAVKVQNLIDRGRLPNLSRRVRSQILKPTRDAASQEALWFTRIDALLDTMGLRIRIDRAHDKEA